MYILKSDIIFILVHISQVGCLGLTVVQSIQFAVYVSGGIIFQFNLFL